ncbi:hypothetical protein CJF31_00006196 [Rutstroemia sp. NJR-2017a BVV2]|nr:hypothetical protein CJF31_00006196 [Rutstroemia sp. NJR-2017a BVV2]
MINGMDPQPAQRQKVFSLFIDASPTPPHGQSPKHRFEQHRVPTPSSTTQFESQRIFSNMHRQQPLLPTTIPSISFLYRAGTGRRISRMAFKGFLRRIRIGNNNFEFRLQHVSKHLHLTILSEALNYDQEHFRLRGKVFHGSQDSREHETIIRMKKDGYSWEDIHDVLPHRSSAGIRVQYSTKLNKTPKVIMFGSNGPIYLELHRVRTPISGSEVEQMRIASAIPRRISLQELYPYPAEQI